MLVADDDDLKILSHFRFRLLVFFNELRLICALSLLPWNSSPGLFLVAVEFGWPTGRPAFCFCPYLNRVWQGMDGLIVVLLYTLHSTHHSYPQPHSHSLPTANYVLRMCFNDVHVITVIFMNSCGNIQLNSKNKITTAQLRFSSWCVVAC